MSYNGSGTFNINSSGQPVVTDTLISSTVFNALTADLGTGLSTAITKDGQTTTTAVIPFAAGMSSTTGVFTGKITATTAGIDVPITALGTAYAIAFTPTITGGSNVDATTAFTSYYLRLGNIVFCSVGLNVDPTSATNTQFFIDLPIASNLTNANNDLGGGGTGAAASAETWTIVGDTTNDRAQVDGVTVTTANHGVHLWFSYIVK